MVKELRLRFMPLLVEKQALTFSVGMMPLSKTQVHQDSDLNQKTCSIKSVPNTKSRLSKDLRTTTGLRTTASKIQEHKANLKTFNSNRTQEVALNSRDTASNQKLTLRGPQALKSLNLSTRTKVDIVNQVPNEWQGRTADLISKDMYLHNLRAISTLTLAE